jgi:hypothetical protein
MQEISDFIKRPNVGNMSTEEEKEAQDKGISNILNKITENFQNLKKLLPIQLQKAPRTPNRLDQNRTTPWHTTIKTTSTEKEKEYSRL